MLSAQKQANHGSPYVLKEADIDSYLQDMESRDRRKGTLDNYHRCLEDFLAWLPEGKEIFRERVKFNTLDSNKYPGEGLCISGASCRALYARHRQHEDDYCQWTFGFP